SVNNKMHGAHALASSKASSKNEAARSWGRPRACVAEARLMWTPNALAVECTEFRRPECGAPVNNTATSTLAVRAGTNNVVSGDGFSVNGRGSRALAVPA